MQCYNFELNPANQSKFYCAGKLTVLMRYTVHQDYTLQNGPGKVFHKFTNSCLPNHADCFFDRENSLLDGNRTDPITVYKNCNLPYCTCQVKQPTPPNQLPTNPISSQGGGGGQTQNKGGAQAGDGEKPKTKEVPNVGMGDKPKINKVPKVGVGEAQMVPVQESPQRNVKFEQDRKRSSTDTVGKNPHKNKRVHRDTCVSDLVWPICKIDNSEYSKRFKIQILKAMTIFHQGMARLMA